MSREQNIATQEQAAEKLNSGDVDGAVDTLFAVDAVDHDPAPGQGPGREGYRSFFQTLATAFPDAHLAPATMVTDDDHVVLAYTLTGTHQGEFNGIPASGQKVEVRGVQIGRFENGQIVERWGSTDELGIMQQIGAAPKPPGTLGKLADKLSG
jgi:steroid delta-isomerase-like uncharacterized protein